MEELERLKKEYEIIRKKYKLPSFSELNVEFEIEKLQDRETEFLIRQVRRTMIEKIALILRFFELIVNPNEASPVYIFSLMKNIQADTKKLIEKIYRELVTVEISSLNLDVSYDEKTEVKFIKEISDKWPLIKKDLSEITKKLYVSWSHEKSHGSYLG